MPARRDGDEASGDSSPYLSTVQAAAALGVSVSTVKRWVDEGILPAHKTAGGHRKLLRAEVLALARQGTLPQGNLTALAGIPPASQALNLDATVTALRQALARGDGAEVSGVIRHVYDAGLAIETLADGVIAPVMAQVGHDWETARIDVWQEHRATQLFAAALYQLKEQVDIRAERNRPIALGGAPAGDPYLLATLLAQLVLLDAGWQVMQLGPNTPLPSLAKAMTEMRPRLVWLSVSHLDDMGAFVASYRELYSAAERQGVAIAIGGRGLTEAIRSTIPYTTYGDRLSHLAAFARTLHPRPRPPRRGRPPRA